MKIFLPLLLGMMSVLSVWAQQVSEENAKSKAEAFLQKKGVSLSDEAPYMKASLGDEGNLIPYYIFNSDEKKGFVIISGSERTIPVLGYSDNGRFNMDSIPDGLHFMLDDYEKQINSLEKRTFLPEDSIILGTEKDAIEPLISTQWDQYYPYNMYCPIDEEDSLKRTSLTGCVATATSQILYYHAMKYKEEQGSHLVNAITGGIPSYSYTSIRNTGNEIFVDSVPPQDLFWDQMSLTYSGIEDKEDPSAKAVANLMMICGKAEKMKYSADGSSSYDVNLFYALPYFGYDCDAVCLDAINFSPTDWENIIYDELKTGRPVYYGGVSGDFGHAFICDGYQSDDYFHFNWGWGGFCNGYYRLSVCDPFGNYKFSSYQSAIIGVAPNFHSDSQLMNALSVDRELESDTNIYRRESLSDNFPELTVNYTAYNITNRQMRFLFSCALYDDADSLIKIYDYCEDWTLKTRYGGTIYQTIVLPEGLPNGQYKIKGMCKIFDKPDWMPFVGSDIFYLSLKVSDTELRAASSLASDNSEVEEPLSDELIKETEDGSLYDLNGRQITTPGKEIFVKGGKKYLMIEN